MWLFSEENSERFIWYDYFIAEETNCDLWGFKREPVLSSEEWFYKMTSKVKIKKLFHLQLERGVSQTVSSWLKVIILHHFKKRTWVLFMIFRSLYKKQSKFLFHLPNKLKFALSILNGFVCMRIFKIGLHFILTEYYVCSTYIDKTAKFISVKHKNFKTWANSYEDYHIKIKKTITNS